MLRSGAIPCTLDAGRELDKPNFAYKKGKRKTTKFEVKNKVWNEGASDEKMLVKEGSPQAFTMRSKDEEERIGDQGSRIIKLVKERENCANYEKWSHEVFVFFSDCQRWNIASWYR